MKTNLLGKSIRDYSGSGYHANSFYSLSGFLSSKIYSSPGDAKSIRIMNYLHNYFWFSLVNSLFHNDDIIKAEVNFINNSAKNKKQVWAPSGFARGFCVLSEHVEIQYKTTGIYNSNAESGVLWSDPDIGIEWPIENPSLSSRDVQAQTLNMWINKPESDNFKY